MERCGVCGGGGEDWREGGGEGGRGRMRRRMRGRIGVACGWRRRWSEGEGEGGRRWGTVVGDKDVGVVVDEHSGVRGGGNGVCSLSCRAVKRKGKGEGEGQVSAGGREGKCGVGWDRPVGSFHFLFDDTKDLCNRGRRGPKISSNIN